MPDLEAASHECKDRGDAASSSSCSADLSSPAVADSKNESQSNAYWTPYLNYARLIGLQLPHYNILLENSRFPSKVDVVAVDTFADPTLAPARTHFTSARTLREFLLDNNNNNNNNSNNNNNNNNDDESECQRITKTRYLLVEDLSWTMIEVLGAALNVPLDFFTMQLDGAFYRHDGLDRSVAYKKRFLNKSAPDAVSAMYTVPWRRAVYYLGGLAELEGVSPLAQSLCSNISRGSEILDCRLDGKDNPSAAAYCERFSVLRTSAGSFDTVIILFDPVLNVELNPYAMSQELSVLGPARIHHHEPEFRRCSPYTREAPRTFPGIPSFRDFDAKGSLPPVAETRQYEGYVHIVPQSWSRNPGTRASFLSFADSQGRSFFADFSAAQLSLFGAVAQDWALVIATLNEALDRVDAGLADGAFVGSNHAHWQRFLCVCRKNTIEYRDDIARALAEINALVERAGARERESTLRKRVLCDLSTLYRKAVELHERCERSYSALMASMSILESRKSIAQAASVNRLSEMAYIFIPLTYVSSVFSMSLKEFEGKLDVKSWCLISIFLTLATYGIRIINRSSPYNTIVCWVQENVRQKGNYASTEQRLRVSHYVRFLWDSPLQVYVKMRNNVVGEIGGRAATALRFVVAAGLAGALCAIWVLDRMPDAMFRIAVTLVLGSWLAFLAAGYVIVVCHRIAREVRPLGSWEMRALFLLQAARWVLALQVNLLVAPVMLVWTEARDVSLGGKVCVTILAATIACVLSIKCAWVIFLNMSGCRTSTLGR